MKYLLYYFAAISLFSFVLAACDKYFAIKRRRRVPERVLFLSAFAGGAAAEFLSMLIFRHKTRHKRFMIGLPVIILLHLSLIYLCRGVLF